MFGNTWDLRVSPHSVISISKNQIYDSQRVDIRFALRFKRVIRD